MRKSRDQVMIPFFDDPRTLTYDIIAIQEPWRNSEFFTTYHPHKDIFHLTYMEHESTHVCCYINKRLALSSWYVNHHSPDLCTIELQISGFNTLHIHNVYNPILLTNSSRCLSLLQEKIVLSLLEEYVILGDFNFHHPVWGEIEAKSDSNSETLLALVKQYGLHLLLKTGTITYNEGGHQSTIDLIFASTAISECLIICKIPNDSEYGSDHRPILSVFNLETINQTIEPRRQFKETDVKVLQEIIVDNSAQISDFPLQTPNNIDICLELLIAAINKSIVASTPLRKITAKSKLGFNSECKIAQIRARRLQKYFN